MAYISPKFLEEYLSEKGLKAKSLYGIIETDNVIYDLKFEPKIIFNLEIKAIEDDSDSLQTETEEPINDLVDFLAKDLPGGELFKASQLSPSNLVSILTHLSFLYDINSLKSNHLLRRIYCLVSTNNLSHIAREVKRDESIIEFEFSKIKDFLSKKNWKFKEDTDNQYLPVIKANIYDIYEAIISISTIEYGCTFSVKNGEESYVITTTPINELKDWGSQSEVMEDYEARKREIQYSKTEFQHLKTDSEEDSDSKEVTVKPGRKSSVNKRSSWYERYLVC